LSDSKILRIYHHARIEKERLRKQFYQKLDIHKLSFELPEMYELDLVDGVLYSIEKFMPGNTAEKIFPKLSTEKKLKLIKNYLTIPDELNSITFPGKQYGDLMRDAEKNCNSDTWTDYISERVKKAVKESNEFDVRNDVHELSQAYEKFILELKKFPKYPQKSLVHGDLFFENILVNDELEVVSLIDFSGLSVVGDYQLDIAGIFNYLNYFDIVSKEDLDLFDELKSEIFDKDTLSLIHLYDVYMAFVFIKDTKYDAPQTYRRSVQILNNYIT
jgi:serine/threonine protein kinase